MANIATNGVQGSVKDIVDLLQEELDELLRQKARIRLRMRNLRRRLGILEANSGGGHTTRSKSRRSRNRARGAQSRKLCHLHDELARACRIAFLEVGGAATPDELYAAIMRRGSFSFLSLEESPTSAVIRALTSMAESGEAVCCSNSRWVYEPNPRNFQS